MTATIEKVDPKRRDAGALERAAAALRDGKLILLPTDTSYELVTRADGPGHVRLRAEETIGRLAATFADVARDAVMPAPARALARKFWPGPLTLLLESRDETAGPLAWRVPGLVLARDVVARAGVPVVVTGVGGAVTFADALAAPLGALADLALDGGPAPLGQPATLVRVSRTGEHRVLSEGFLSREQILRALARTILFVCTGNTCRSPMAEAIFRGILARRLGVDPERLTDAGFIVKSAGTSAASGGPAAEHSVEVVRERGLDLSRHRTQPLTPELLEEAEIVMALSPGHAAAIADLAPDARAKVRLVDEAGVPDPIGGSLARYRETADLLEERLAPLANELLVGKQAGGP